MTVQKKIFFYDGDCGFCDATVNFFLKHSRHGKIYFCSLQHPFAQNLLTEEHQIEINLSTAYFYDGQSVFKESDAIMKALFLCKAPTRFLAYTLWIIPPFVRNAAYKYFAKNRLRVSSWFKDNCRLLTKEERLRFVG